MLFSSHPYSSPSSSVSNLNTLIWSLSLFTILERLNLHRNSWPLNPRRHGQFERLYSWVPLFCCAFNVKCSHKHLCLNISLASDIYQILLTHQSQRILHSFCCFFWVFHLMDKTNSYYKLSDGTPLSVLCLEGKEFYFLLCKQDWANNQKGVTERQRGRVDQWGFSVHGNTTGLSAHWVSLLVLS